MTEGDGVPPLILVRGRRPTTYLWMGGGTVETEYGPWKHGVVRTDLTREQAAQLPAGFAVGEAQEMGLEWEDWRGLLGAGTDALSSLCDAG